MYVVGRGVGLAAALEIALKLKETCRLHAEAFSTAELRHGPIALVEARLPRPRDPAGRSYGGECRRGDRASREPRRRGDHAACRRRTGGARAAVSGADVLSRAARARGGARLRRGCAGAPREGHAHDLATRRDDEAEHGLGLVAVQLRLLAMRFTTRATPRWRPHRPPGSHGIRCTSLRTTCVPSRAARSSRRASGAVRRSSPWDSPGQARGRFSGIRTRRAGRDRGAWSASPTVGANHGVTNDPSICERPLTRANRLGHQSKDMLSVFASLVTDGAIVKF